MAAIAAVTIAVKGCVEMDAVGGLDRTLAVVNGKGGVFKTSICSGVGGLAAAAGWNVGLVDFDPQANLTEDLGLASTTDEGAQQLQAIPAGRPLAFHRAGRDRLSIAYGGHHLHDLQAVMQSRQGRDPEGWAHGLAAALAPRAADFDLVLIDCPPGNDVLQTLALVAARYALIPTRSDASSRKGLRSVAARFQTVRPRNPLLELLGVVRVGTPTNAHVIRDEIRREVEADLGGAAPVLETTIRYAESAARTARNSGRLPHELEPVLVAEKPYWQQVKEGSVQRGLPRSTTGLAQDYAELTQEILDLVAQAEGRDEPAVEAQEARR